MKISSELKTELLKANSEEEVKALLGDAFTPADAAFVWEKLQAKKDEGALEALDDDELEAVSGGGEEAANGHKVGCWAGILWYSDWEEANERCCAKNSQGGWEHKFEEERQYIKHHILFADVKCKYCGYRKSINMECDSGFYG